MLDSYVITNKVYLWRANWSSKVTSLANGEQTSYLTLYLNPPMHPSHAYLRPVLLNEAKLQARICSAVSGYEKRVWILANVLSA